MSIGKLAQSELTSLKGEVSFVKLDSQLDITIHDNNHSPVSSATVSGVWSNGASGSASCQSPTNAGGQCMVSLSGIRKNVSSVTFTVNNVTHSTLTYDSGANHDPDGDSNGTSVTVSKP